MSPGFITSPENTTPTHFSSQYGFSLDKRPGEATTYIFMGVGGGGVAESFGGEIQVEFHVHFRPLP